jgi:hypothetical protein
MNAYGIVIAMLFPLGVTIGKKAGISVPTNSFFPFSFQMKASCNTASVDESLLKTERQYLFHACDSDQYSFGYLIDDITRSSWSHFYSEHPNASVN